MRITQLFSRLPLPLLALSLLALVAFAGACGGDDEPATPQPATGASVEAIETEDALILDARLFAAEPGGTAGRLVILLHMFPADQTSWFEIAVELQDRGISALTLDFRGYGASGGSKEVGAIDRDVRAALAFARERGFERVVLVGASMGGTAAIVVAAEEPVDGVMALSAPVSFRGLDAGEVVASVPAPLLVVASEGDISAANALEVFSERAPLDADHALLVRGRAHGTDIFDDDAGDRVRERLFEFLDEVWGG